jgi:hypothetical protein
MTGAIAFMGAIDPDIVQILTTNEKSGNEIFYERSTLGEWIAVDMASLRRRALHPSVFFWRNK